MNWAHAADPLPGVLDVIGLNYQGAGIRKAPGTVSGLSRKVSGQVYLWQRNGVCIEQPRRIHVSGDQFKQRRGRDRIPAKTRPGIR